MTRSSQSWCGGKLIAAAVAVMAVYGFAHAQCTETQLVPSNQGYIFAFGQAVDIDDGRAIVGSAFDMNPNGTTGRAYIFERDTAGDWSQAALLTASDGHPLNWFGHAVAIDGDTAVVGAPLHNPTGLETSGAAYVFQRQPDGQWTEVQQLTAESPSYFMSGQVDIAGDRLIVGSQIPATITVFQRKGDAWIQEAVLDDPTPTEGGLGVASMALDGESILALTPYAHAYVFRRSDQGEWLFETDLRAVAGGPVGGGENGAAILGDIAVVGDASGGAVDVFRRDSNGVWMHETELLPEDAPQGSRFGGSVGLTQVAGTEVVMVGAKYDTVNQFHQGSTTFFRRKPSGAWVHLARLAPSSATLDAQAGYRVAIDGVNAIVGAWAQNEPHDGAGAAYVIRLGGIRPADVTADCAVNINDLFAVIGAWGACGPDGPACLPDIDGNGQIGIDDLFAVILSWD